MEGTLEQATIGWQDNSGSQGTELVTVGEGFVSDSFTWEAKTFSGDDIPWLSLSSENGEATGELGGGDFMNIFAQVNANDLEDGIYNANISITSPDVDPQGVQINLTVTGENSSPTLPFIDISGSENGIVSLPEDIDPLFSTFASKYTHIPTERVIDDMELLGWKPIEAKEVKARKLSTRGFQKHLLVFRNDDVVINGKDGDTVFPQILLTNSHDGKNAFTFQAGLYRLVCENGLVIADTQFEDVKMRHMGYTFEDLQEKIKEMVEKLPLTVESMNKMKAQEMEQEQIIQFAKDAINTRFSEKELNRIKIDIDALLKPTRIEDKGSDLWSVFNVVQEKIIDGDFEYRAGGKLRKARQIKNFKQDMKINKELFEVALNYVN